jgi:hypothetical protein
MAAELFIPPSKALDANANPYAGAKWFFYATGTTTPQSVYTTFAMGTAHANPVVADSSGKFANIFFDPALVYRGVLKNADESVTLHDIDPISGSTFAALATSGGAALVGSSSGLTVQQHLDAQPIDVLQFAGSHAAWLAAADVGVFIRQAVALALVRLAAGTTQNQTIVMPAGSVALNLATETLINDHRISLVGAGSNATVLNGFNAGRGIHYRLDIAKFSVDFAGRLGGFTIKGTATAGQTLIEYGDVIGLHLFDLQCLNATGTGSVGLWGRNFNYWTERTFIDQVYCGNNKINHRITGGLALGGPGTNSFGYSHYLSLNLNAYAGQIGWQLDSNTYFYNCDVSVICNVESSGTVMKLQDTASFARCFGSIRGEQTIGSGGSGIVMSAGTFFLLYGYVTLPSLANSNANGVTHAPTYQVLDGHYRGADGTPNFSNTGSFNYRGTASCVAGLQVTDSPENPYCGFGNIVGTNVSSPFALMYDSGGGLNAFTVYRYGFDGKLNAMTECGAITSDGDVIAQRRVVYATDVYRQGVKILGTQGAAVANGVNAAAAPTQAEFNALVTQFNALLTRCRDHGLIAT